MEFISSCSVKLDFPWLKTADLSLFPLKIKRNPQKRISQKILHNNKQKLPATQSETQSSSELTQILKKPKPNTQVQTSN